MLNVRILPLAQQDLRKAALWYNAKQKGLGLRFTNAFRAEISYITKNPNAVANRYKNTRTKVMSDFPYMIHFYVDNENHTLIITAVFHTSLNPAKWNR